MTDRDATRPERVYTAGMTTTIADPVLAWRREQFVELGFDAEDAEKLAEESDVDLALVRRLVAQGASHELVLRIVL